MSPLVLSLSLFTLAAPPAAAVQLQPPMVVPGAQPGPVRTITRLPSPLQESVNAPAVPAHLRSTVAQIDIDEEGWRALDASDDVLLAGLCIAPGQRIDALLHRREPFAGVRAVLGSLDAAGSIIDTPLEVPALTCFGGTVAGDPGSRVFIARHDAFLVGFVIAGNRRWIISSPPVGRAGPVVAFEDGSLPPGTLLENHWQCDAIEPPDDGDARKDGSGSGSEGGVAGEFPCRQVRIAVETDHEYLLLFGANQGAALAYTATMFSALNDIYSRDVGLRPSPCMIRLWATNGDPWTAGGAGEQLGQFRNTYIADPPETPRDSATFLSGRSLGGGVAWVGALCGGYAYSVSGNLGGYFPYPLVDNSWDNWDIMVVAHELGHNAGSPHTHQDNPPADGCGSDPQDCTAAVNDEATIMSYCHLCDGGMSNIDMRFHPVSIESITSYLNGSCDFTPPTQPPTALPDYVTCLAGSVVDIDVLANDIALNCEGITSLSVGAPGDGATAVVVPGAGPSGRDIIRFTAPGAVTHSFMFPYTVSDPQGHLRSATIVVDAIALRYPENPGNSAPGIIASYYQLSAPEVLPDFTTLTQYSGGIITTLNYASTTGVFATSGRADEVGAVFRGWINVPASGFWRLYTTSDDGSRLLIGDTEIVSNDGLHGMQERSGLIALAAGKHAITVEFFEYNGGAGLTVSWEGPTVAKAVVPAAAWTRGGYFNWADINRNGTVDGTDLALLLAAWGSSTIAADIDQDGTVSGADLAALLANWGWGT